MGIDEDIRIAKWKLVNDPDKIVLKHSLDREIRRGMNDLRRFKNSPIPMLQGTLIRPVVVQSDLPPTQVTQQQTMFQPQQNKLQYIIKTNKFRL